MLYLIQSIQSIEADVADAEPQAGQAAVTVRTAQIVLSTFDIDGSAQPTQAIFSSKKTYYVHS